MNFIKNNKLLLIFVSLVLFIFAYVGVREIIASKEKYYESYTYQKEYEMNKKVYNVNEYSKINITDNQMANIYIADFTYYLFNDTNYAYNLLNEECKNNKFRSYNEFADYVSNLNYSNFNIDSYSVSDSTYNIYTTSDLKVTFKLSSIMEYEVCIE